MSASILSAGVDITDPWAFHPHFEVWMLVAALIGMWVYAVRVIGPRAVGPGSVVVTRRQVGYFVATIALLWFASDWPLHDIGETYLYSAHMLQHMTLSYLMPPLAILATPEWLLRIIIGNGKVYRALRFLTRPVVAAVPFNLVVMVVHIPGMVNASGENGALHYGMHFVLVSTSLLMWMPVIGPFKELQMGYGPKMVYLFAQSVIPTVPAGWLTFADRAVYKRYDIPVRVWGVDVIDDQQIAGAIMKVGGTMFMWSIIIFMFFKRFSAGFDEQQSYRRRTPAPTGQRTRPPETLLVDIDEPALTFEQVTEAFDRTPAAAEPERRV